MKISKLKIAIYIIILMMFFAGYIFLKNNSTHTVVLDTPGPNYKVYLSTDVDRRNAIVNVTNKTSVKLRDGYYCVVVNDSKYEPSSPCFMIYQSDLSFMLKIDYSKDYLKTLLKTEQKAISDTIKTKYASIIDEYIVCDGVLYGTGTLYGGVLYRKPSSSSENKDVYRFILKKDLGWSIIQKPVIILDKYTFFDIPINVLKEVNSLPVC